MHKPKFKILSIDGGGIRGIIPCVMLKAIEMQAGYPIHELFDLIVGTSTGGIITLGLTTTNLETNTAFTAKEMLELYTKNGNIIFGDRKRDFLSKIGSFFGIISDAVQNTYDDTELVNLLEEKFGNNYLKDVLKNVLVTSYELEDGKPFLFSSRLANEKDSQNFLLKKIARSTSAAPTYFNPSIIEMSKEDKLALVDGGVFANNPAILAYAEAKELWIRRLKEEKIKMTEPVVTPYDEDFPFFMLSIGTGSCPSEIKASDLEDRHSFRWFKPLLTDIFMRSVSESTHYTMQHLLPPYKDGSLRYKRIDMELPKKNKDMDNASEENVKELQKLAEDYIKAHGKEIIQICNLLK